MRVFCKASIVSLSLFFCLTNAGNIERLATSCEAELHLECEEGEMIVVHEAAFTPDRGHCDVLDAVGSAVMEVGELHNNRDILLAVVRKCSGVRGGACTFNMLTDLAESQSWGRGRTDIGYSCEAGVLSYCGGRVSVSGEGYISSPGYPRYYLGGRECIWNIMADLGQKIELDVVDLALRDTGGECEDKVEVREEGLTLMSLCGDLEGRAGLVSSSRGVELRMRTAPSGQSLYPHRGLLLHYNVQGCPTPGPIADGRVEVAGDGLTASLHCDPEHVLQSSLTQSLELSCDNKTWAWAPAIAHCVSIPFLLQYANSSVVSFLTGGQALRLQDTSAR